jgi:drug/metabolite transporter (DMT)-like permease
MPKLQKGVFWMLTATLFFSIMGLSVKLGSLKFSPSELVFYRSSISLVFIYFLMHLNQIKVQTNYLSLHLKRSITGFVSLILFFYAIAHLPLGTAISLNYTSPLFVGFLLPFVLNRKLNLKIYASIFIGFLGVFCILKPVFQDQSFFAGLMGLLSGFGAALAYLYITQLGQLKEPDIRTVFYFTLISTVGSATLLIGQEIYMPAIDDLIVLLILGTSATIAQIALTRAYRVGNTLSNAGMSYLTIIFSALLGLVVLDEAIDMLSLIGIVLIILSGIFVSFKSSRLK